MEYASAKDFNGKSGVAQRTDLQCASTPSKGPTSELTLPVVVIDLVVVETVQIVV
jgi:hypothetical protein